MGGSELIFIKAILLFYFLIQNTAHVPSTKKYTLMGHHMQSSSRAANSTLVREVVLGNRNRKSAKNRTMHPLILVGVPQKNPLPIQ